MAVSIFEFSLNVPKYNSLQCLPEVFVRSAIVNKSSVKKRSWKKKRYSAIEGGSGKSCGRSGEMNMIKIYYIGFICNEHFILP